MNTQIQKINTAMIIDDNELDVFLYKRIIKRSNRIDNVISFAYATDALEYLRREDQEKVDVIFLDINMPLMNGFEFLAAATDLLTGSIAQAVVVMLTTSMADQDKELAEQFDIVKAYINKPLAEEDIDFIVDQIVPGSQEVSLFDRQKNTN